MCVDYKAHSQALAKWARAMKANQHADDEKRKRIHRH